MPAAFLGGMLHLPTILYRPLVGMILLLAAIELVRSARRAFGLQPHRTETFKLSTDPLFAEKVRDIVGLSPHPTAPSCCA